VRLQAEIDHLGQQCRYTEARCQDQHKAREAAETAVGETEGATRRLAAELRQLEAQDQELLVAQLPLRESCARLAQKKLQKKVRNHFSSFPPEPKPESVEEQNLARRLGLAGLASKSPV